jgi:sulfonate transport system substrate-binding protein
LAAEVPSLRFAYQDRLGSVIPIVAVHNRFFEAEGLAVTALQFNNGPACAEALYSGAADVAGMGDTAALILVSRNSDSRMLASHATGEHRHRVMVRSDSPWQTLEDLRGKTIGVKKGTSTYGGLLLALAGAGIPPEAVRIVDLQPPTLIEALAAGSIDAFAASEPTPSTAEARGARQLLTLGGLGNEYPVMLLARRQFVSANDEALQRFFRALKRAEAFIADHPEETAKLLAEQSGLDLPTTRQVMARHVYRVRLDAAIGSSLGQTAAFLKNEGIIENAPDLSAVVDRRYVADK